MMKAFALFALALLLLGGLTACQSSQQETGSIDSPREAEKVVDNSVDQSFVAEDDTVELGEMI